LWVTWHPLRDRPRPHLTLPDLAGHPQAEGSNPDPHGRQVDTLAAVFHCDLGVVE